MRGLLLGSIEANAVALEAGSGSRLKGCFWEVEQQIGLLTGRRARRGLGGEIVMPGLAKVNIPHSIVSECGMSFRGMKPEFRRQSGDVTGILTLLLDFVCAASVTSPLGVEVGRAGKCLSDGGLDCCSPFNHETSSYDALPIFSSGSNCGWECISS